MNSDFEELLQIFAENEVRYLIVGGYAVIHYARPRFTKNLDLWIDLTEENATRVVKSFSQFGIPMYGVEESDFADEGTQFSVGVSPNELDFLTTVPGLKFEDAWENRKIDSSYEFPVQYLGRTDLILAKETAGRPQDLADLDSIRETE